MTASSCDPTLTTGTPVCAKCEFAIHGSFTYVNAKPYHPHCVSPLFVFRQSWVCTRCGVSNAPHVDRCGCSNSTMGGMHVTQ